MARRLGADNVLIIQDNISDSEIHLNYRMPGTKEIVSYRNGATKRVRNALVNRMGENRLEHGQKILTGFREGDFEKQVKEKWVPLASDPKSKNYDPEWKNIVSEQAADLIETLAVHVFDASSQVLAPVEDEADADEGQDIEKN